MTKDQGQMTRGGRRSKLIPLVVLVIVAVAGGAGVWVWQSQRAYHLAVVQPGVLWRDGAKSARQFATALDEVKPKTVVSLVDAVELADASKPQFAAEAKECEA